MASYELRVGLHYLRAGKDSGFLSVMGWITVAGILVGVMALVLALSFASGFESVLRDKIIGVNAHLLLLRFDGEFNDWQKVREKLHQLPEVAETMPFTYHKALLRSDEDVRGIVVRGVWPASLPEMSDWQLAFSCGGFSFHEAPEPSVQGEGAMQAPIWLGNVLAEELEVRCGDTVRLVAMAGQGTGTPGATAIRDYRVEGVFEVGMYEYDASLAFLSLGEAQDFFGMESRVTGLEVRLEDIRHTDRVEQGIQERLGYPFWVKTWREINPNFFSALKLQKVVMFLVLILIILVGGFNIISTLIMNVLEKRREVAILKAMGATQRAIGRVFLFQGLILGLIGALLGLALGYGLCFLAGSYPLIRLDPDIYYLSHLPVEVRPIEFLLVGLSAVVLCALATIYPARQAAKLDPAEVLRYE
jgi:lipoprotein-releasing system permease protein